MPRLPRRLVRGERSKPRAARTTCRLHRPATRSRRTVPVPPAQSSSSSRSLHSPPVEGERTQRVSALTGPPPASLRLETQPVEHNLDDYVTTLSKMSSNRLKTSQCPAS